MLNQILKNKFVVPETDFIVKETIGEYTFVITECSIYLYGVKEIDITNFFVPFVETKIISLTKKLALMVYDEKLCDNFNLEHDKVYHFLELHKHNHNSEKEKIILCFSNREDRGLALQFLTAVYDHTVPDTIVLYSQKGLNNENN